MVTSRVFTWDPKWNIPEIKFCSAMKKNLFTLLTTAGEMKWNFFSGLVVVKRPIKKYKQTTRGNFWIWLLERWWTIYLCFIKFVKLYRNFICIIGSASEIFTTPTHQSSRKSETSASFHDCRLQYYQEKI